MLRTHEPWQAVFRSVLPEVIDWWPFPAFPPSVRLAVIVGQPPGARSLSYQGKGALWSETDAA